MTKDEAVALFEGKFWEPMAAYDRAMFQLWEDRLCMPWGVFMEALGEALGRPVYTHELGLNRDGLKEELLGLRAAPTITEVLELIPVEQRVVVEL